MSYIYICSNSWFDNFYGYYIKELYENWAFIHCMILYFQDFYKQSLFMTNFSISYKCCCIDLSDCMKITFSVIAGLALMALI